MNKKPKRLCFIDETRALAIISMIIAHFGPGVFQRLPSLGFLAEPVLFLGRFATTTFIVVFGVTLGFVYFDSFQNADGDKGPTERDRISTGLYKRARLLALSSLVICIPNYINLALLRDWNGYHWLFNTYSILNYYTLALASAPLWLRLLGPAPMRRCLGIGAAHWLAAQWLLHVWPQSPTLGLAEYARMHLVSGPYGYLQLSGTAILSIPVGRAIRRELKQRGDVLPLLYRLLPLGAVIAVVGWGVGLWVREFDIAAIVAGTVKTPPRGWYFLFFGGFAFILLGLMGLLDRFVGERSKVLYPLSLFGQASLGIYTGHRFVLPSLGWLDQCGVAFEGMVRIVLPFALFAVFCLVMMYRQHVRNTKGRRHIPTPRVPIATDPPRGETLPSARSSSGHASSHETTALATKRQDDEVGAGA